MSWFSFQKSMPGGFLFHPISILAVVLLIFNDFYLKGSGHMVYLAGKLSDVCLMIFLPLFLAFAWVFLQYFFDSFRVIFLKKAERKIVPSKLVIYLSLFISGFILTALQLSDSFNSYFEIVMVFIKSEWLGEQVSGLILTKDKMDLIALVFLFIPHRILMNERKVMDKV